MVRGRSIAGIALLTLAACSHELEPAPHSPGYDPAPPVAAVSQLEEGLEVGMRAPDFETKDVEGKSFRLSDYRGKVVLLDFWGFW